MTGSKRNEAAPVNDTPNVGIFRDLLLPPSETFIAAQAMSLRRYSPYFIGGEWTDNELVPRQRSIVMYSGYGAHALRAIRRRTQTLPRQFLREVADARLSLIHAHFGTDAITALDVARSTCVPLIVTFHGFDATVTDSAMSKGPYAQRLYIRRRTSLIEQATLFLTVSNFLRSRLLEQGFPESRTLVHYTGVDLDKFRPPPEAPRQPIVLFVGRLVEKKGARFLIEALTKIHSSIPSLSAVLIGDGPERLDLEALARGIPRVVFRGTQSPDQVRSELARAKVLCVPSVTAGNGDAEGFGMVFAEAQAMGVPVVSFASGGIPEAVAQERTGLLSPEGDVVTLARDLSTILRLSHDNWRTMSENARAYATSHFDLRAQTDRLEFLYDRAVESRRSSKRPGDEDSTPHNAQWK